MSSITGIPDRRKLGSLRANYIPLTKAIEQMRGVVIVTDNQGNITFVNPEFEKRTGYMASEVIGKNPRILKSGITPDEVYKELWNKIIAGGNWKGELCNRAKDGSLFWEYADIFGVVDTDGKITHFVAIKDNITELKKAEDEHKKEMLRFKAIIETSEDGFWVIDSKTTRILDVNERYLQYSGYSRVELLGMHVYDLDVKHSSEDINAFMKTESSRATPVFETRHRTKDGTTWPVEVSTVSLTNDEGRRYSFLRNITERKISEERQRHIEQQLNQSQKMEALGTLAGGVAHDFNNLLAIIAGNLELARQDVGINHPALESLSEIEKMNQRAKDLVQQILAFSRNQTIERKEMSLGLVIVESSRLLRSSFKNTTIKVNITGDAPPVLANAGQINQVIFNLCNNASQAMENQDRPGMLEIILKSHEQQEMLAGLNPGHYALLIVRDNGPGMSEQVQSRMFEPFFTTKPAGKGTGLGLSVVHGILKAHEASIQVQSSNGGTTFQIFFPSIKNENLNDSEISLKTSSRKTATSKRIIYIDDEKAIVFLMKRLLERKGYAVSGYTDPHEAILAIQHDPNQFDLVVTDYNMPGMSGLEVAQAVKEVRSDLPIVLASGHISNDLRAKAPFVGIRELIYKPNTVDELCEAVERTINK